MDCSPSNNFVCGLKSGSMTYDVFVKGFILVR